MALGDARPGAVDWLAAAVGPSMLVVEDVPAGWVSLTAVVVSSLDVDGVLVETCGVSQTGTTVTVSLSGVQIAALGDVVHGWRLLSSGVPVLAGRWKAEPVPSAAWQSVSVVVGGGVRVVVSGASGSVGVTDHGALSGLGDDDHTQYLTSGRHGVIGGNPHGTTAGDVGADPAGTASGLVAAEAVTRAAADTALDGRLDVIEAISIATDAELAAAVAAHEADTTGVHGIADTSALATTAAMTAADALKVSKAGDTMTGALAVVMGSAGSAITAQPNSTTSTKLFAGFDQAGASTAEITTSGLVGTSNTTTLGAHAGSGGTGRLVASGFVAGHYFARPDGVTYDWRLYRQGSGASSLFIRDEVNSRQHLTFTAGAAADAALTYADSRVNVGTATDLGATLGIQGTATTRPTVSIKMIASQTAVPFRIRTSADVDVFSVTTTGGVNMSGQLVIDRGASGQPLTLQGDTAGVDLTRTDGTPEWRVYRTGVGASSFHFRDLINSRMQFSLTAGASSDAAQSYLYSRLDIGGGDVGATLGVTPTSTTRKGILVKLPASGTGNPFEIQNSAGANLMQVTSAGFITTPVMYVSSDGSVGGTLSVRTFDASSKGLVVRGQASQTGNLFEVQNSTGTVLFKADSAGTLAVTPSSGIAQLALASAASASQIEFTTGARVGLLSQSSAGNMILRSPADTALYADFGFIMFLRDQSNGSRNHVTLTGGATSDAAKADFLARANVGTATDLGATLGVQATSASRKALVIKLAAGQTDNAIEVQNSAGTPSFRVNATGHMVSELAYFGGASLYASALNVVPPATSWRGLVVRGLSGQTGNLIEAQDDGGTVLRSVLPSGRDSHITANTATTVGAAGAAAALPVLPLGYLLADIAGTSVKIPYYTA